MIRSLNAVIFEHTCFRRAPRSGTKIESPSGALTLFLDSLYWNDFTENDQPNATAVPRF
jgi:hypothetical protein